MNTEEETSNSSCNVVDDQEKEEEEETLSDSFICCVCLDLLYKPIVLECGHVSCFWCVHKSMNPVHESQCPICRNPYYHFSTICEMLHFLLLKMYPLTYKRRTKQMTKEEQREGVFSPQLLGKEVDCSDGSKTSHHEDGIEKVENRDSSFIEENNLLPVNKDRTCDRISRGDVLCSACMQLLFRPAVLNCGHVYCETCITVPEDGFIVCKVCQSPHPSDVPNVCLEFNTFLEEHFPEEYALRRQNTESKQVRLEHKNPPAGSSSKESKKAKLKALEPGEPFLPWWNQHGSKVHPAVGCDNCGMYPIVGDRYKCLDCKEDIGFDLCGDCYNTRSKRPGRFNQQHTPEHRFELVQLPGFMQNFLSRLVGGQINNEVPILGFSNDVPVLGISATDDSSDGWIAVESGTVLPTVHSNNDPDGDDGNTLHANSTQNVATSSADHAGNIEQSENQS